MPTHFCLTVRYLQPYSHGRRNGGVPEWPPSPLRVFQSLVAASAARWNERMRIEYAAPALGWLERFQPPEIVAAVGSRSDVSYRLYVPDNVADKVAGSWSAGRPADIAEYRTEKDVRPTHLTGDAVHYLFPVADDDAEFDRHFGTLQAAARSVTHVGWGVDMVAGNAERLTEEQAAALPGERWRPADDPTDNSLRVPIPGTLANLIRKHEQFLGRLSGVRFDPVPSLPPLTAYRVVGYRRATDPAARLRGVAFRIVSADPDDASPSFDAPRRTRDVAAWVRHAAGKVCTDEPDVATFVHGHDPADDAKQVKGDEANARLLYLPLPTINPKLNRVEAIRRVLIAGPVGHYDRVRHVGRLLEGEELRFPSNLAGRPPDGGEPARDEGVKGVLAPLSSSDWVLEQYTWSARVWATVTPVILPGYDDRNPAKAEKLLRRAFVQTGLSEEVVADVVELAWRNVGFRPGVDLASRYCRPDHLTGPAYHVRVRFRHPVRGPLAVGAGRYRGFGVFAAEGD